MGFLDLVAYSQEVHLLVEEDLVLVLVVHPLDVPQHIFLGDDSEQTPVVRDQRLAEAQLLKHVHHRLHGRLVRDGHWRQIHDPEEGKMEIKLSKTTKRKLAKHEKGCKTMGRGCLANRRGLLLVWAPPAPAPSPWLEKNTTVSAGIASKRFLAALIAKLRSLRRTKPTRY